MFFHEMRGMRLPAVGGLMAGILAVVVLLALPAPAPANTRAADDHAARAEEYLERGRAVDAWEAILHMDGLDREAGRRHEELVRRAAIELNRTANREVERGTPDGPEQAIAIGQVMRRQESRRLVGEVFGEGQIANYDRTARLILGLAHLRQAQQMQMRGRTSAATESILSALGFLDEGEPGWAAANHDIGVIRADQARAAMARGDEELAERLVVESIVYFRQATEAAAGEERYARLGEENEQRLLTEFARLFEKYQTDEPEPEPEGPATLSEFFSGDVPQNFLSLFRQGGWVNRNADMLIAVGSAAGAFILFYWVIPGFVLGRISRRGDVLAGEMRMKVKLLGLFALGVYLVRRTTFRRADRKVAEKHGCPHCGFRLDNPADYVNFVFSRCPKCDGTITPMHNLEGHLRTIAEGLGTDVERVNRGAESMERFVSRESVGTLMRGLITLGVRRRASDLHFEPGDEALIVRQRIDGMMTEMIQLPRSLSGAMVSAIKVESNLNIAEKRVPQDGKMQLVIDKADIDIRVATSPSGAGEKASLRLLDIRSIQMDTRHLGMTPNGQAHFEGAINSPHGLVLVSGPTGSGKTTTLYVALQKLRSTSKNIISIEDPIEFRIPGVTQMQVNVAQGLTFAGGLRSILRQDPDIIMVGEIRDRETAEISVNSAVTGHLVFSTLHTIDSAASVARLIDLGVTARQFADALNLVIAQRLLRLTCTKCATEYDPPVEVLSQLGIAGDAHAGYSFLSGAGCKVCNRTGFYRRSGVFECLVPGDRLRTALEKEHLTTGEIREIAIQGGMKTLRMEALEYLRHGLTTAEEILRVTR